MASKVENKSSKVIVVVGGGITGALVSKSLKFHAHVVFMKEYFEITVKHSDYFTKGRIVIAYATGVTDTEVLTSDGEHIPYDYLVIATGTNENTYPISRSKRLEQYKEHFARIKSADSVLVIGGGSTGVELAGEIAADFPEKKPTLALDWFISKNVNVILDQTVDLESHQDGDKTYKTSGGETIMADCHFYCTGIPWGMSWLKDSVLRDALKDGGRVMVDEHLREIKQGLNAIQHANVTVKNLRLLMHGGNENKMATYEASPDMAVVSLGRKDAVMQSPMSTMIGRIPGFVKSSDQFVGKTRRLMGIEASSCFGL
ncbi:hypothetical protein MKX01_037676 [Papaver californicum]|nr:hypothetical protein MKX01_037676 [Papaver californicum]